MRNRDTLSNLYRSASAVAVVSMALVLAGCSSMGSFGRDPTVTNASGQPAGAAWGQAMPAFIPPANIGGGAGPTTYATANQPVIIDRTTAQPLGGQNAVATQDLPPLQPSVTSTQAMPAQTAVASLPASQVQSPAAPTQSTPQLGVVSGDTYTHTIASGESLYTIARRYDVSATDIIAANNISAPDRIAVGQRLVIPGRADLLAQRGQQPVQVATAPSGQTLAAPTAPAQPAPVAEQPVQAPAEQVAALPAQQPAVSQPAASAADKFRWPLSGRVITDFAASRGTGINIEAPEGSSVRAAEGGEIIYVGNAVEGYGNLILIKHANGYVSAYAHLKTMGVVKGDMVNRGDAIGTVGMTGASVTRPQLHFQLRRGATPVDPAPLLAG